MSIYTAHNETIVTTFKESIWTSVSTTYRSSINATIFTTLKFSFKATNISAKYNALSSTYFKPHCTALFRSYRLSNWSTKQCPIYAAIWTTNCGT